MKLIPVQKFNPKLKEYMAIHYSQPKSFVGRSICYLIEHNGIIYGGIAGGSATKFLPGRDDFFSINKDNKNEKLKQIISNIFYHIEKVNGKYPVRNFVPKVLSEFCKQVSLDWEAKYGDKVIGFESLVELPRTGEIYQRDGWTLTGQTVGYTCKRPAGKGTDSWSGMRVWDTKNLRPKLVFCKLN